MEQIGNKSYILGAKARGQKYAGSYRYGFNGKENDNELKGEGNQQDYGMRIYDPSIGRFLSVDPISGKYPYYSPYHFAGDSPIISVDIDGLEPSTPQTLWTEMGTIEGQTIYYAPYKDKIYYVAEARNYDAHGNSYFQYTDPETNKWAGNFTSTGYEERGLADFHRNRFEPRKIVIRHIESPGGRFRMQ